MQFNSIPTAVRVPFAYVEFDSSQAAAGGATQVYKLLLIGQKLTAGTQPVNTPVRVTSTKQANLLFGAGSMLAAMYRKALAANNFTETWCVALEDDAAGVAATGTVTLAGTATADGTLSIYVGGKNVRVPVLQGATAAATATSLATAINAEAEGAFTAAAVGAVVTLTARHKGLYMNGTSVVMNYYGEQTPGGLTVTIADVAGGTTNPSIAPALAAIGDTQYRVIVQPYTDAANLTLIETELALRWGPLYTNDGHAYTASNAVSSALMTLGDSRNSPHLTILSNSGSPTPAYEAAAVFGAVVANFAAIDPARPLQTLPLTGVLPAAQEDQLILSERNSLLYSGIATTTVDSGGVVRIERAITTYNEDSAGNPDESMLDVEVMNTLSYLRFDFRAHFGLRYPRHKLGRSGTRYAAGQAVMTPSLAKAEAIGKFLDWEERGLVEDAEQFQRDLIVEIDSQNPNRLNFLLPPNLINGLRILAAQIAFRS